MTKVQIIDVPNNAARRPEESANSLANVPQHRNSQSGISFSHGERGSRGGWQLESHGILKLCGVTVGWAGWGQCLSRSRKRECVGLIARTDLECGFLFWGPFRDKGILCDISDEVLW